MSESVIYADVQFKNLKNNTTFKAQRTHSTDDTRDRDTEVNIIKAGRDPLEENAAAPQQAGQRGGSKVKPGCNPERIAWVLLCVLLAGAVACLTVLYVQTNQKLQASMVHYKTGATTGPPVQCSLSCEEGWQTHGEHCYYFSNNSFTWAKSRERCQTLCGDLVKVESHEEQEFLEKTLRSKMTENEDKFWIGLTDSKTEGEWLWVDGSPLNESFWSPRQPDDWKEEDCVRMGEMGGAKDLKCWFDMSCDTPHRMICEKQM